jgi:hypothetical protein
MRCYSTTTVRLQVCGRQLTTLGVLEIRSDGIGRTVVRRFRWEGAKVGVVDNRTAALARLVADLGAPDALLA